MEQVFKADTFKRVRLRSNRSQRALFASCDAEVEGSIIRLIAYGIMADVLMAFAPGAIITVHGVLDKGQLGITDIEA